MKDYFVWACTSGRVLRIPASTIPNVKQDQMFPNNGWLSITMPCYGVGVDSDQNVWGVDSQTATRAIVDKTGAFMQPQAGQPMGNNKCPAGDKCSLNAGAYTYSDFTGFGLRNFTRPSGTYSAVFAGCKDGGEQVQDTQWYSVVWDADVPPNTSLDVRTRSGATPRPDLNWGQWTTPVNVSPLSLGAGVLVPNLPDQMGSGYLEVEFTLKTNDRKSTPKLKSFQVGFKCQIIG